MCSYLVDLQLLWLMFMVVHRVSHDLLRFVLPFTCSTHLILGFLRFDYVSGVFIRSVIKNLIM